MKPRIRTVPPRSPRWRSPPGSRRSPSRPPRTPRSRRDRRHGTLTLTGDDAADNITLGVDAAGNITHNLGAAGGLSSATDFDPGPAVRQRSVRRHGQPDRQRRRRQRQHQLLGPELRRHAGDQRRRRRRHHPRHARPSTRSTAATATTASPRFRGNETIHGGDGNDVIIWNNGDGNDINEGDAGVDETLITEGTADDGNVGHAGRRDHALRPRHRRRRLQRRLQRRWRS